MKTRRVIIRVTEAQLRVLDYALFDFIESSTPEALRTLGYSKAVAQRAYEAVRHPTTDGKARR